MTEAVAKKVAEIGAEIAIRPLDSAPVFATTGRDGIAIRAGTKLLIAGTPIMFSEQTSIDIPSALVKGGDYMIVLGNGDALAAVEWQADTPLPLLGGFHYAPGGNAEARSGGDAVPAINPYSIWDIGFRPACKDPRGMALVVNAPGLLHLPAFWVDIYLLGTDHLKSGTSAFGQLIADGARCRPLDAAGELVPKLDYATARTIVDGHGKQLLSQFEFYAAAYGVTERASAMTRPTTTGLDMARTSRFGMMQATGNLYVWGHDADPDDPRASFFGGSWDNGEFAGSRYANVGPWPGHSHEWIGARGRSDHLQLDA